MKEDGAVDVIGPARTLGVGGLLVVAALHANWARGASWPLPDRPRLAETVAGREEMPPAIACLGVAALLTAGAGCVGGHPRRAPQLGRLGAAGLVTVLAGRGLVGVARLMPEQRASAAFARWDRRLYSPLCLVLASLCATGIAPR